MQSRDEAIIFVVVQLPTGGLRIYIRPDWQAIILPSDQEYITSLLSDFEIRISTDPDALFEQLSSLAVGPLITYDCESDPTRHSRILEMASQFVDIQSYPSSNVHG